MKLALSNIKTELESLAGWHYADDAIYCTFVFHTFAQAFGFMAEIALAAETAGHHPDWRNVYTTVEVTLTTHDAGGVTAKDIALAHVMDAAAA